MTDEELERFCAANPDCGCNCMSCPAFGSNHYYNLYGEDEEDDPE